MGSSRRALALLATISLVGGCFGYNRSAKRWSYLSDSVLILGGGATIAIDRSQKTEPCMGTSCPVYHSSISGGLIAGVVLVAAGVFGIVFNATRPIVKTSR